MPSSKTSDDQCAAESISSSILTPLTKTSDGQCMGSMKRGTKHKIRQNETEEHSTKKQIVMGFKAISEDRGEPAITEPDSYFDHTYCTKCRKRSIVMTEDEYVCTSCGLVKGQIFVHKDGGEPQHPSLFLN